MKELVEVRIDMEKNNVSIVANGYSGRVFVNGMDVPYVKHVEFIGGAGECPELKIIMNRSYYESGLCGDIFLD